MATISTKTTVPTWLFEYHSILRSSMASAVLTDELKDLFDSVAGDLGWLNNDEAEKALAVEIIDWSLNIDNYIKSLC